jgi:L-alanine-DL-glutamate epimerase-like enolase superfamily enzyme
MKITKVEAFVVHCPIPEIADSFNVTAVYGMPGVFIETDAGITGTGWAGTLGNGDDLIRDAIERYYAPVLLGQDPFNVKKIWNDLFWSKLHWVGRSGVTTMAHAAVDIALWDIMALASEKPLWQLLGGDKPKQIKSYNTHGGWLNKSVEELITDMKWCIDQGWTGVKMKVGKPDPREDYARVRAVRKALGPDIDLMLDVNQTWDLNTAMTWGKRLEEFMPLWLEEPMHPDDIRSHRLLAQELNTPIALGEHIYSKFAFRDYIQQEAVEYVQVDVTRVAGVTEWLQVAALAACYNLPVVPHIGDVMQVQQHLVAATPNAPMLECIPIAAELFVHPVTVKDGFIQTPQEPGAGTALRPDFLAKCRIS